MEDQKLIDLVSAEVDRTYRGFRDASPDESLPDRWEWGDNEIPVQDLPLVPSYVDLVQQVQQHGNLKVLSVLGAYHFDKDEVHETLQEAAKMIEGLTACERTYKVNHTSNSTSNNTIRAPSIIVGDEIKPGDKVILSDPMIDSGATIRDYIRYVNNHGGQVVAIHANSIRAYSIPPTQASKDKFEACVEGLAERLKLSIEDVRSAVNEALFDSGKTVDQLINQELLVLTRALQNPEIHTGSDIASAVGSVMASTQGHFRDYRSWVERIEENEAVTTNLGWALE